MAPPPPARHGIGNKNIRMEYDSKRHYYPPITPSYRGGGGLPDFPQVGKGLACPFWGPMGPKIGAEGAVLENFGKFLKKVAKKCNRNQFCLKFWINKNFRMPLVNRPEDRFLGG